jgi:hypothetical protein
MIKLIYNLKILMVATSIYCHNDNASAKGAAQQAQVVVDEVDKICKGDRSRSTPPDEWRPEK